MRPEKSWSLLDPRPVLLYLPKHDEYIVYWNGIVMTHSQALCLAMEIIGIYPTPEMREKLEETFARLYFANAFETNLWDHIVKNKMTYNTQKNALSDHIYKLCHELDPKTILSWFDYSRARIDGKITN